MSKGWHTGEGTRLGRGPQYPRAPCVVGPGGRACWERAWPGSGMEPRSLQMPCPLPGEVDWWLERQQACSLALGPASCPGLGQTRAFQRLAMVVERKLRPPDHTERQEGSTGSEQCHWGQGHVFLCRTGLREASSESLCPQCSAGPGIGHSPRASLGGFTAGVKVIPGGKS